MTWFGPSPFEPWLRTPDVDHFTFTERTNTMMASIATAVGLLGYFETAMKVVEVGTKAYQTFSAGRDLVEKARAEGRNPTEQEWTDLATKIDRLEGSIAASGGAAPAAGQPPQRR